MVSWAAVRRGDRYERRRHWHWAGATMENWQGVEYCPAGERSHWRVLRREALSGLGGRSWLSRQDLWEWMQGGRSVRGRSGQWGWLGCGSGVSGAMREGCRFKTCQGGKIFCSVVGVQGEQRVWAFGGSGIPVVRQSTRGSSGEGTCTVGTAGSRRPGIRASVSGSRGGQHRVGASAGLWSLGPNP